MVEDQVVCKEFDAGLDILVELINEDQEKKWTQYCTLYQNFLILLSSVHPVCSS